VRYPNVYGIDMPAVEELIAHNRTVEEICTLIGADRLIFQDVEGLIDAVRRVNPAIKEFDVSCFNGQYITGDVSPGYLAAVGAERSDDAKARREAENNALNDLYVSSEAEV
jgi:amidophosphoribosyltransferase